MIGNEFSRSQISHNSILRVSSLCAYPILHSSTKPYHRQGNLKQASTTATLFHQHIYVYVHQPRPSLILIFGSSSASPNSQKQTKTADRASITQQILHTHAPSTPIPPSSPIRIQHQQRSHSLLIQLLFPASRFVWSLLTCNRVSTRLSSRILWSQRRTRQGETRRIMRGRMCGSEKGTCGLAVDVGAVACLACGANAVVAVAVSGCGGLVKGWNGGGGGGTGCER